MRNVYRQKHYRTEPWQICIEHQIYNRTENVFFDKMQKIKIGNIPNIHNNVSNTSGSSSMTAEESRNMDRFVVLKSEVRSTLDE